MKRSLGIFAFGITVGLSIGFGIFGRDKKISTRSSPTGGEIESPTATATSLQVPDSSKNQILLGEIETVPFQELYGLLSQRTPAAIQQLTEQLNDLPPGPELNAKIRAFFQAWAHLDPASAFAAGIELKTADARRAAVSAAIEGSDASAAGALVSSVNEVSSDMFPPNGKMNLLAQGVTKWAQVDAVQAAKFLDRISAQGMAFSEAWYSVAQNWVRIEPQAAMQWAQNKVATDGVQTALNGAITAWWQRDSHAAEAYVTSRLNAPDGRQMVSALADFMASTDPGKAIQWLNQLSNVQIRNEGYNQVALQWAFRDPEAASKWTATLPPEALAAGMSLSVSLWAQRDPGAVAQWVESLKGASRDRAIGVFSSNIAVKDPSGGMNWASTISDGKSRDVALLYIANQWLEHDPVALRSWIQNSALPDAEKARLLALKPGN